MADSEQTTKPAAEIRVGDVIHKQREIWFEVASIERSGEYVCFHAKGRRHWKNYRLDTPVNVRSADHG